MKLDSKTKRNFTYNLKNNYWAAIAQNITEKLPFVPGHCLWLHLSFSIASPTHALPPYCAIGLLQSLVRDLKPEPHV